MRKIIALGIVLLFLGMTISSSTGLYLEKQSSISTLDGNTLYVGGNGTGNYTKIQEAIDNASDGDTVYVYDDSSPYHETIEINVSINLIGENKNTTIIGEFLTISILKDQVLISSFTIRGGINCQINTSNIIIVNNHIVGYMVGISLGKSSNNLISKNLIECYWEGILLFFKSNGNTISDNIFRGNYCGIFISYCNKNNIVNNTISGSDYGLFLDTSFFNIIRKNNFIKNNHSICLINSSFNLLFKNYWDDWKLNFPRPINGSRYSFLLKRTMRWIFCDWHPAQEPYDIGV